MDVFVTKIKNKNMDDVNDFYLALDIRATWDTYEQAVTARGEDNRHPKLYYCDGVLKVEGFWVSWSPEVKTLVGSLLKNPDNLGCAVVVKDGKESELCHEETMTLFGKGKH